MTDRILDLSEGPADLHVRHGQLRIERPEAEALSVPLDDLAVLVVSHPRVTYTHSVLTRLSAAGGALIACDEAHLPACMLLPLAGHYVQAERFARQARASRPTQKRLWRQIVRAKVRHQARLLEDLRGHDAGLRHLARRVRSADPTNVEAQASRRYWPFLFDDPDFRRRRDVADQNRLLNYGYAVLRAVVARAICAAGLHPSLGLHHANRYDGFCLADDLMEPFRPVVDRAVAEWVGMHGPDAPLDRAAKAALLEPLTGRFVLDGASRTLFDVLARTAASLVDVYAGQRRDLLLPEW